MILYITEQGGSLHKSGERLVVEKFGKEIQWVHAFKIEQIIIMGNVQVSPHTINYLLEKGIDTVFLSTTGRYRGRLISQFGKNILLRQIQFRQIDKQEFILALAKKFVEGKLKNYRTLLRRHNRELRKPEVEKSVHRIRNLLHQIETADNLNKLRGIEGNGTNTYYDGFRYAIKIEEFTFDSRTRRPPKDAVNAMLSFGYTLLANTIHTAINIAGLDPYLGCLHVVDYGRPSLVLDVMEEFRPVLVDSMVLRVINKKIITYKDFFFQKDVPVVDHSEDSEPLDKEDYPVLLTHEGIKKFVFHYESQLQQRLFSPQSGKQITYRDVCLEQVRLLVRHLKGEGSYTPFVMR